MRGFGGLSEECHAMISRISHEVRNPVAVIHSFHQLLLLAHPELSNDLYFQKIQENMAFLNAFNELYAECTDAEKKQFMQAFIERIDIFPERREDGNWIRNIKFRFPLPVLRDGKEVVRVDGISLDKEQPDEHTVTLEKFPTLETVVALHHQRPTVGSQNNPISGGQ